MITLPNATDHEAVSENYKTQDNLSVRINLHQKYDKNLKWSHWIFENYHFFKGCNILELGCGNGAMWEGQIESLPEGVSVTLTDFSEGMVDIVRNKFGAYPNFIVKRMDIQNIDFNDKTFDVVIANSMLYHVPDLPKAVSEAYRALKPGGLFYCSTFGVNGQQKFFRDVFRKFNPEITVFEEDPYPFVLQNGYEILREKFENVVRYDYIDSLDVTDAKDIYDYVMSMVKMSSVGKEKTVGLPEYFESMKDGNGIISVPREYCTFISQKR